MPYTTWGDPNLKGDEIARFRGEVGVTKRICVLTDPAWDYLHYDEKLGFFRCLGKFNDNGNCDEEGECCRRIGEVGRKTFSFAVLVYSTGKDGTFKGNIKNLEYEFMLWNFGGMQKINILDSLHAEWDLTKTDLMIECATKNDEQYQRLTIHPAKECYHKKNTSVHNEIMSAFQEWKWNDPEKWLGRTVTKGEIMDALDENPFEENDDETTQKSKKKKGGKRKK